MERTRQVVKLATLLGILLLVLASAVLAGAAARQADSWRWVVHTRQVLGALESVAVHAAKAESEQRAFLVTREPQYLDAFRDHAAALRGAVEAVRTLTVDNPIQQQRIPALRDLVDQRLAFLSATVGAVRTLATSRSLDLQPGAQVMQRLESLLEAMRAEESVLLRQREQQVAADGQRMLAGVIGLVLLAVVLIAALRWTARRDLARIESAHRALSTANATLEEKVAERTERLEEANAHLEGFARTVAHDLRTPLRNIEGFAEAVLEDEAALSDQGADYLRRIGHGASRMDRLITDLLQFSRTSKMHLVLGAVALDDCVRAAIDGLEADVERTGATVEVQPALPQVVANAPVLRQVLANLLGNALKFVPPGERPHVEVSARRDGSCVLLTVRDHGIGIPADQHERIFGVFERLHPQERYDGTGMGLAIVRQAVVRMGGRVEVASAPGKGTVFTVRLPAAAEAA